MVVAVDSKLSIEKDNWLVGNNVVRKGIENNSYLIGNREWKEVCGE